MPRQAHSPALALETITIQNRLAGDACLSYRIGESRQTMRAYTQGTEARFSDCLMTLESSLTSPERSTTSTFRLSLDELDAAQTTILDGLKIAPGWFTIGDLPLFRVRLLTAKNRKVIEVATETIESAGPTHEAHKVSELEIGVKSMEAAARLADAFRRAIALCTIGGNTTSRD